MGWGPSKSKVRRRCRTEIQFAIRSSTVTLHKCYSLVYTLHRDFGRTIGVADFVSAAWWLYLVYGCGDPRGGDAESHCTGTFVKLVIRIPEMVTLIIFLALINKIWLSRSREI